MSQEAHRDGSFDLSWSDGVLSLRVMRPEGGGRLLPALSVFQRLKEMGIRSAPEEKVITVVQEADGQFHPLVEYQPAPAKALVEIDPSGLEAFVTLIPPQPFGTELSLPDLRRVLEDEGVAFGVSEAALRQLTEEKPYHKKTRVAAGEPPKEGAPGTVELLFDPDPTLKLKEDAHGRVDFHEIETIKTVLKDQPVARRTPPHLGEPGTTVLGEAIAAPPGSEATFRRGLNTVVSEDGQELLAAIDGHITMHDAVISVEPVLRVHDVDFKIGNINFNGAVVIQGSVLDGFHVVAKGDILVSGTVGVARLESGGNIVIQGGLLGGKKATLTAAGDVQAKFIDDASVTAERNVIVAEYIMHSQVTAGRKVILRGTRGTIIGGVIRAGEEIQARIAGSPRYDGKTLLEAGPVVRRTHTLPGLTLRLKEEWERYRQVQKNLRTLRIAKSRSSSLPPEREALTQRFRDARDSSRRRTRELAQEAKILKEEMKGLIRSRVIVWDTLYPGVKVQIGNQSHNVIDPIRGAKISIDRGELRVMGTH
ncbi:MAG TPA: FapA family protein [Methylomirabilota bacterium]|nr:FapA family protein [Methylomirabilota bacterium]